ncbi:SUMF1/EgtB/PvdO family nonheme iron enzyme [Streptomyces sp. NPDC057682]|uniref:SUMF1/EgtB/PvdO family nonheme iron enzyme n=1 Tax=Streptomyces sp. NPDC057682 TaxID=3346210 RepID=UPI0036A3FCFB
MNTVLLARALHDPEAGPRPLLVVPYEQHVTDPAQVQSRLNGFLGIPAQKPEEAARATGPSAPSADPTFATTARKDALVVELASPYVELLTQSVGQTLLRARQLLPPKTMAAASEWLSGGDLYEVRPPMTLPVRRVRTVPVSECTPKPQYVPTANAMWRNVLVSNAEMAEMLNLLHEGGAANSRLGTHLLVCPMPQERGGRLHYMPTERRWRISPGYESHPAYWVTWIGAALMAAWCGARLPTRAEALHATQGARAHNSDYLLGDSCPVAEPGLGGRTVHHLIGNVQIWCSDGPDQPASQPVQRYLFGAAWNTPGTKQAVTAIRSRYLLGSSRGVGVRLVRDAGTTDAARLGAWELAHRLNQWVDVADSSAPTTPGALDRMILSALTVGS